ncbi:hypothetical protein LTR95_017861 [Oleoguttula sp. CCFEE 5521]
MLAPRLLVYLLSVFAGISRADRPQCGPADTDAVERRGVSTAVLANPHYAHLLERNAFPVKSPRDEELVKRKLTPRCDIKNLGQYLNYRILGAGESGTIGLLDADARGNGIVASCLADNSAFRIGTGQVSGCTVLTVVSTRAVYMGHFWESLSMDNQVQLTRNFLNLVFGGTPKTKTSGPAIDPTQFTAAGDQPHAFIMSPRALEYDEGEDRNAIGTGHPAAQGTFEHATFLNQLRTRLLSAIPGIVIEAYDYEVTADGFAPAPPARLALFEYDPKADAVGPNWRLFQEGTMRTGRTLQGFGQPAAGSSGS